MITSIISVNAKIFGHQTHVCSNDNDDILRQTMYEDIYAALGYLGMCLNPR